MSKIEISRNEFKLLISKESHPEYDSSFDREFVEEGKGSDIIVRRKIVRYSDSKVFYIYLVYNTQYCDYSDDIYDGNFVISENKKDIYDEYGEIKKEPEIKKPVPLTENELLFLKITEKSNVENFVDFEKSYIIPPEELRLYIDKFVLILNNCTVKNLHFMLIESAKLSLKYSVKYESIFHTFSPFKKKIDFERFYNKYNSEYQLKHYGFVTLEIGNNETIKLTKFQHTYLSKHFQ